jgi:hypothetical protein
MDWPQDSSYGPIFFACEFSQRFPYHWNETHEVKTRPMDHNLFLTSAVAIGGIGLALRLVRPLADLWHQKLARDFKQRAKKAKNQT